MQVAVRTSLPRAVTKSLPKFAPLPKGYGAGGVFPFFPTGRSVASYIQTGGMVSADGHCETCDARTAQGTVFGSGLRSCVVKRLHDALTDGDHYLTAVIRGFAQPMTAPLKWVCRASVGGTRPGYCFGPCGFLQSIRPPFGYVEAQGQPLSRATRSKNSRR